MLSHWPFNQVLDCFSDGSGADFRRIAFFGNQLGDSRANFQIDAIFRQPRLERCQLELGDFNDGFLIQRPEDHDFIQAIQKFRPKTIFEFFENFSLDGFKAEAGLFFFGFRLGLETQSRLAVEFFRTDIRSQDDDSVFKISFLALAAQIVLTHQERFDGSGYPFGLAGDA